MECAEAIRTKKEQIIELYGMHHTEFKTQLKTFTDVESMIDSYTTIYVYIAARRQVLQILGNYKPGTTKKVKDKEGNEKEVPVYTKTIIYNYQKKKHKDINEYGFMEIYSQVLEICSLAEQLIMYKKIEVEENEIKLLQGLSSKRIDKEKIRKFLEE